MMPPENCSSFPSSKTIEIDPTGGEGIDGRRVLKAHSSIARHRPLRILFINSALQIGADTWIHLLLLRSLPRDRLELHAACQPGSSAPAFDAFRDVNDVTLRPTNFGPSLWRRSKLEKITSVASGIPLAAMSMAGLAAYIRRNRIDILHSTDRPRDAIACAVLARATGAKALIHAHVNYGDWMSRGVKWALGQADAIVGVSRYTAQSFAKAGYQADRCHGIPNAIDIARWDPTLDPRIGRASLGVADDAPLILGVARLFAWKGPFELVRALAPVAKEFPNVRLAIVGSDYPADSGTTQALKDLARELGIGENVLFTGQRSDVPALMAACDVFSLPSMEEPFGLVFAEAMAMQRPVAALNNGGTPEVVDHGRCGLLSGAGDVEGLSANLLRLLRDPALRREYGANGRTRVEVHFAPHRLASDFTDLYARMLA